MDTTKLKGRLGEKVQDLQKSIEATPAADTSLSQTTSGYLALNSNTLEIIRENLKSQMVCAGPLKYGKSDEEHY